MLDNQRSALQPPITSFLCDLAARRRYASALPPRSLATHARALWNGPDRLHPFGLTALSSETRRDRPSSSLNLAITFSLCPPITDGICASASHLTPRALANRRVISYSTTTFGPLRSSIVLLRLTGYLSASPSSPVHSKQNLLTDTTRDELPIRPKQTRRSDHG